MSGTELATVGGNGLAEPDSAGSVARIEAMGAELPALIEAGDTETIKRMQSEGKAAHLAAQQLGLEREAVAYARLAIRCAAARGQIMGERGDGKDPRLLVLGAALMRGRLEPILQQVASASPQRAMRLAADAGVSSIPRARFAALVQKRAHERGMAVGALAAEAHIGRGVIHAIMSPNRSSRCQWWSSYRIARAIGVDISNLPPVGPPQPVRRTRAKWVTHKMRAGGGRWDDVIAPECALRDAMTKADRNWSNKPLLYEAMKAVSDIIQREVRAAEK